MRDNFTSLRSRINYQCLHFIGKAVYYVLGNQEPGTAGGSVLRVRVRVWAVGHSSSVERRRALWEKLRHPKKKREWDSV